MLLKIRDKAQGWIAYVIVILISIPFALWGIHEYTGGGSEPAVAKVGDVEITQRALDINVNNYRTRLTQQFGGRLPDIFTDEIIRAQVLNSLINEELLNQKTADLRIRAGDQMVSEEISSIETFQRNGQFDPEVYRQALSVSGSSSRAFEEQIRASLGSEILRSAVSDTEPVTDAEIDALLKLRNQQRVASWITVDAASVQEIPGITDAEIEEYYNENKEQFPKSEQVRLEYVELNLDSIADTVTIDDEEVRAFYDDPEKQKQFISEEQRGIRHILIKVDDNRSDDDARQEAERILGELNAGADFAELATAHSEDTGSAAKGGDLGLVKRGIMVKPFEDAAFSLEKDQISEPVRSRFGYHIIQVTDIEGGVLQPFEEVSDQIARELKRQEAETLFADKYDQLGNLAYATPDNLQPAAEALGLEVRQSDWLPKTGGIGPLSNPKIISTVFAPDALESRFNSDIIELSVDDYIVARVIDYEPQSIKPLDEVSSVIRGILETEKRSNLVADKAGELLGEIEGGKDPEAVAEGAGFSVEKEKEIGREEEGVPAEIRQKVFAMSAPEQDAVDWDTVELASGSYAIVGLHAVRNADPAAIDQQERDSVRQEIATSRGRMTFNSYLEKLRDEIGVTIVEN
jgi:peptidyl-prolyl cis-trans isomerase D